MKRTESVLAPCLRAKSLVQVGEVGLVAGGLAGAAAGAVSTASLARAASRLANLRAALRQAWNKIKPVTWDDGVKVLNEALTNAKLELPNGFNKIEGPVGGLPTGSTHTGFGGPVVRVGPGGRIRLYDKSGKLLEDLPGSPGAAAGGAAGAGLASDGAAGDGG